MLIELKKRLKEKYMQLRKENAWAEDEMLLQQAKTALRTKIKVQIKEKTTRFKGRCFHCGKYGHNKVDCRDWLKLTKEEWEKES